MITRLTNVPQDLAAFKATGEVPKDKYENVVCPSVKKLLQKTDVLNDQMIVGPTFKNFRYWCMFGRHASCLKKITK